MTSIFHYRLHFPHLAKYRNIAHFKRLTFNLHLYAFPCSAYHFPCCAPFVGHGSQGERHLHRHHQSGNGPRLREHHADISRIHQDRENRRCQPRHPQWYLNKYLGLYVQNDLLLRRVHLTLQIYEFIFYYQ